MSIVNDFLWERGTTINNLSSDNRFDPDLEIINFKNFLEDGDFVVVCDIDTDGLSAANVILEYFDVPVHMISPNQRGFTLKEAEEIAQLYPGKNFLTVDCGTNSIDAQQFLESVGSKLYVTDHHFPSNPLKRNIYNPKILHTDFSNHSGSSIIYLLLENLYGYNQNAIQYAAVGTIADVVPVLHDNRYVIKNGLNEIARTPDGKLRKFLSAAGLYIRNEKDVAFSLAPMLNSPRRMGRHDLAYNAYINNSVGHIKELKSVNEDRKFAVDQAIEKAERTPGWVQFCDDCVFIYHEDLPGISGLIASKYSKLGLNAVGISMNPFDVPETGSIRSIVPGIDRFIEWSDSCTGGGHAFAGGVQILDIDQFVEDFCSFFKDSTKNLERRMPDLQGNFEYFVANAIDLDVLAPFGAGWPRPLFASEVRLSDNGQTKSGYKSVLINESVKGMIWTKENIEIPKKSRILYEVSYNGPNDKPFVTINQIL